MSVGNKRISAMQEGGKKLAGIRDSLLGEVEVGKTGWEIDQLAERLILAAGGKPSFQMVPRYPWTTCICTNDIIVHGIPSSVPFKNGDIVGIDVGMYYKGFHTDTSWTKIVGISGKESDNDKKKFLKTGEEALKLAIDSARVGNRVGHISQAIQTVIEKSGYSVIRALVGHGIGNKLHQAPEVPGYLSLPLEKTPLLTEDETLAIEVIYAKGKPEIIYDSDGWTIRTRDGSLSGLFEQTVLVGQKSPVVLT